MTATMGKHDLLDIQIPGGMLLSTTPADELGLAKPVFVTSETKVPFGRVVPPEPASLLLLGTALIGGASLLRRKLTVN
jgi:hypothetical protein